MEDAVLHLTPITTNYYEYIRPYGNVESRMQGDIINCDIINQQQHNQLLSFNNMPLFIHLRCHVDKCEAFHDVALVQNNKYNK